MKACHVLGMFDKKKDTSYLLDLEFSSWSKMGSLWIYEFYTYYCYMFFLYIVKIAFKLKIHEVILSL